MADKARHAFGMLENVDAALSSGAIDSFDVLFLKDANGKPYVGWIDKEGNKVIVEDTKNVVDVEGDSLPESGEAGKIYIFGEEGYFWNGTEFVNLCKPTDVTALETQIGNLETQMGTKVDEKTVRAIIEEQVESSNEIIEF